MAKTLSLSVQHLHVVANHSDLPETTSLDDRLGELHEALKQVHAGLVRGTKPREPRFMREPIPVDGGTVPQFTVLYNSKAVRERVIEVVRNHGFSLVPKVSAPGADTQLIEIHG